MVSYTVIHAIDHTTYRHNYWVVYVAGLRLQSLLLRGFKSDSCTFLTLLYKVLFPLFWKHAHGIFYHFLCYWPQNQQAGWPSGMRRWFPGTSLFGAVGSSPTPVIFWHSYTMYCFLYFEHLHMVSPTTIHAIDHKRYRQDGRVVWGAGLKSRSLRWRGLESQSLHFVDITIQSIDSLIFEHLHMSCSTIIHGFDHKIYRQYGRVV